MHWMNFNDTKKNENFHLNSNTNPQTVCCLVHQNVDANMDKIRISDSHSRKFIRYTGWEKKAAWHLTWQFYEFHKSKWKKKWFSFSCCCRAIDNGNILQQNRIIDVCVALNQSPDDCHFNLMVFVFGFSPSYCKWHPFSSQDQPCEWDILNGSFVLSVVPLLWLLDYEQL